VLATTIDRRSAGAFSRLIQPFRSFWRWWIAELAGLIPTGFGRWLLGRRVFAVHVSRNGDLFCDGAHQLRRMVGRREIVLTVPPELSVLRTVRLPAETRANLAEILELELDKYTPFRATQAIFGYAVDPTSTPQKLVVLLAAAPLSIVEKAVESLGKHGLRPNRIVVAGERELSLQLTRAGLRAPRFVYWPEISLAASLLAVLYVGVAMQADAERARNDRLTDEVNIARRHAREATTVRAEVERLDARIRVLRQRDRDVTPLNVLAEITALLPDHTWLQELNLAGRGITMVGVSQAPGELIETLERSPLFHNVRFRAAVTPTPDRGRERFEISMGIEEPN
jgi:general secretion pathway protein L